MSQRFYTSSPLEPGPFELDGPEAHHLAVVCRIRPGDVVCLFNGDGADFPAKVLEVGKKRVSVEITERRAVDRELGIHLEVAAAIPTADRTHFLVEKLTELGVTVFVPLICDRSAVHPKESALDKLRRGVIEASKQCGRNVLMRIDAAQVWPVYASAREHEIRLFAHPGMESSTDRSFGPRIRCAIGPEGGFTQEEVDIANANEWCGVDLGPRILRVETAAIAMAIFASKGTR